ncbi:HD-GYP domain-containing protein [Sporosalibacterium faouarense]|uniref:HD-GYP domain-containing protein n=1 Tax=Sporosalibacterium faouarense TaxID=516123 RepID=UPI00141C2962|nr:HD-GYP domain-containing protein [Sporosalibacterium faouarense]MTI47048.1 HD-GYP domain-containing protein [Bacillota bacterium]
MNVNSSEASRLGVGDDNIYTKMELILDIFEDMHILTKEDFLKRVLYSSSDVIPEVEKGSFFELVDDKYRPILAMGYDFEVLSKLELDKDKAFIGFECSKDVDVQVYETYISERDNAKFSDKTIEIFKELGTYSNFTSLYAPIKVEGECVGLLSLENFNNQGFSSLSKKILKYYARLISKFYSQMIHRERETKRYYDVVTALVSAIEVKDVYTQGHGNRVRKYSIEIAKAMELSKEQLDIVSIASLLHDIGKIGIPTSILNKPGPLTDEEYEVIKQHPIFSKKILSKIDGFVEVKEMTYAHHENFDGSGYPLGLKGIDIPIEAQIIQIADAFDAMTSERAYRRAMSRSKAIGIIQKEAGRQFHPKIAEIAIDKVFKVV